MVISILSAFSLLIFLYFSDHANNFLAFFALPFLIVNAFYVFVSRTSIQTSELLRKASAGLAMISFELQFRAQEAQNREEEAEKNRFSEHERARYKLKIAKDMLQHISQRPQINWKAEKRPHHIIHQLQLESGSATPPGSLAAEADQSSLVRAAREDSPQSSPQKNSVSSANIFK